MDFAVSALMPHDIEHLRPLARIIWQKTYAHIITQAQIDYMLSERYSAEHILKELALPHIRWEKASVAGTLLAFSSTHFLPESSEMKLDKLYVHPDQQGKGLGRALVDRAIDRAREHRCRALILAVNKHNTPAQEAYRRYGFHVRDAVCVDIGQGFVMDDFIMEKPLDTSRAS